jgi:hypothetical protein
MPVVWCNGFKQLLGNSSDRVHISTNFGDTRGTTMREDYVVILFAEFDIRSVWAESRNVALETTTGGDPL